MSGVRLLAGWTALLALLGTPLAHADATGHAAESIRRGKVLFLQCRACHAVAAGESHKVGPNLHGVMNRKAAAAEGFVYSPKLAASGLVWDTINLDRWIERPWAVVPGTTMVFAGIASATDRHAIIAYLEQATR